MFSTIGSTSYIWNNTDNLYVVDDTGNNVQLAIKDNGNVGIGTTSPDALLHVRAATNVTGTIEVQGGKATVTSAGEINSELNFGSNDSSATGGIGGSIKSVTENTNGAYVGMSFYTAKQGRAPVLEEAMRIDQDGKVGIGISAPAAKLHINSAYEGDYYLLGGTGNLRQLRFSTFTTASPHAGHKIDATSANGIIALATGGTERMRINSNGSVGINSTSTSYKLDVGGNARFQDSVYINTSTGAGGLYVTRLGGASESVKIYTTDSTSIFETFQDENTGGYGSMAFILDDGAPDPSYAFRYGSNVRLIIEGGTGNVGIGTTIPSAKLHVFKSSHPNAMLARFENPTGEALVEIKAQNDALSILQFADAEDGNVGAIQYSHSDNSMRFKTSDAERMRIDTSGNVGIGTTSPTSALSISKSMGAAFIADFINPAVNGHGLLIQAGGTTGTRYITQWKDALGTERFHMEDNGEAYFQGNVGIGYTSPNAKLAVNGDFGIQGQLFTNTGIAAATGSGVANGFAIPYRTGITTLSSNYNYIVRLTTTGTGTDSGSYYLVGYDVATAAFYTRMVSKGGSNSNHPQLAISGNTMVAYHTHASSYNIRWSCETIGTGDPDGTLHNMGADYQWQRDANNLYYNDGNVEIGTTSPTFKLHVNSTDASDNVAYIHHNNAAQSSGDVLKVRSDAGDNAGSALLNVANNTGSALYVRGDRNVGIGTL
jgi:hypothetical protein